MMRRAAALAALVGLLAGPPWLLLALGFRDWAELSLLGATDVRLLLALLTAVGWFAWVAWVVALTAEAAHFVTGRRRLALPGLTWPRALAGALLAAALTAQLTPVAGAVAAPAASAPRAPHPVVEDATGAGADGAAPEVESAAAGRHVTHRVQLGDDLWSLAERYYGSGDQWRKIVEANPQLADDPLADLTPGTSLVVPDPVTHVTVRAGDSLSRIAGAHLGDPDRWPEIFALNRDRIVDPDLIDVGWTLRVPMLAAEATAPDGAPPASEPGPDAPSIGPGETGHAPPPRIDAEAPDHADGRHPDEAAPAAPQSAAEGDLDDRALLSLVGGLTSLTAAAVLGGLSVRRYLQAQARPVGRRYATPEGELARFEAALGAVRAAHEPDREDLLECALRRLSAHWHARSTPVPALAEAVVGDHDLEFAFATDPGEPPVGFQQVGDRYAITWGRLRDLGDATAPVAYPALVTLGEDSAGHLVMVDVLASGLLGVRDSDGTRAGDTLSAMLVELACAPWADELRLLVVTPDETFASIAGAHRVRTTPDADAALHEVERITRLRRRALGEEDAASLRLDPDRSDAWAAHVVLFETPPTPAQRRRLAEAIEQTPCGVAAILPVDADAGDATWQLTEDRALVPQAIPVATREAISGLYALAETTLTVPAPWWSDDEPEDPVNIIELRPRVPETGEPRLLLLGPIELAGAAGQEPNRGKRQCVEYCAWLLEHPASTATQMAADLFVTDGTRRSNLSRLRAWLGAAPDGSPYLPEAYSGRMTLHRGVTSDWHDLLTLTTGGINRLSLERVRVALGLVRGAPLADAAPGAWGWAEPMRSDMVALIRDLGVLGSRLARERRDLDTSRWCADRALAAAPDDELLLGERIRTERAAGRLDEVERLVGRLHRQARILGLDLLPETVDLIQECLEGRLRARQA